MDSNTENARIGQLQCGITPPIRLFIVVVVIGSRNLYKGMTGKHLWLLDFFKSKLYLFLLILRFHQWKTVVTDIYTIYAQ